MNCSLILGVTDSIQQFFADAFGGNAWLATIIISFIPLIELKGGILFGSSTQFWKENALSPWEAYACGLLSGLVIILVLAFLLKPVFNWLKKTKVFKKFVLRLEKSFRKRASKIDENADIEDPEAAQKKENKSALKKMLGVFLFVAVPLPLTGVWTGTAVAVFLDLKWWQSILATFAGDVVAGAIIAIVGTLLDKWLDIAFYVILCIALAVLVAMIIKMVLDGRKEKKALAAQEANEDIEPDNSNTEE